MKTGSVAVRACVALIGAAIGLAAMPAYAQRESVALGTGVSAQGARWNGWAQFDAAYAWPSPSHFANLRTMGELSGRGAWEGGAKWKLAARASLDGAYSGDHYPQAVRRDQRAQAWLHEAYVDFSRGDWEFRLGKQNIVWGEMVGLFFADVVSAKDLREFVLPEFERIRIPQWAARAEWFGGDTHLEVVWLPVPARDLIGEPGAEFYPAPLQFPGLGYQIAPERRISRKLSNSGFGLRVSTLVNGWDLAAFVYRAPDSQAAFERSLAQGGTAVSYQARHDLVTRVGGTLAKDFEGIVLKAEVVHSNGRRFGSVVLDATDGLLELGTLDWVVGADLTPADGWRVNAQLFQRRFLDYDPRIGLKRNETGASLLVARNLAQGLDLEGLAITSLVRSDRLLRATLVWKASARTRVRLGADVVSGDAYGLFGRFGDRDRVWGEVRYSF